MRLSPIAFKYFGVLLVALLSLLSTSKAGAQVLWYNGDNNGTDYLLATNNTDYSGIVYDDFNVTSPGGWQVNGVYGNFLLPDTVTSANWVVLSGVTAGVGGSVVQSGSSPVTLTAFGSQDGFTLYNVAVTGLNFNLGSGTYWLGLQPVGTSTSDYGYLVTTSGASAVGTPPGNNSNAFWTESELGIPLDGLNFTPTTSVASDLTDFSLGVTGAVVSVPEPSSWALMLVSAGFIACLRLRSRRV